MLAADLVELLLRDGGPVDARSTGSRYFWTNTLGTIYVRPTTSASDGDTDGIAGARAATAPISSKPRRFGPVAKGAA